MFWCYAIRKHLRYRKLKEKVLHLLDNCLAHQLSEVLQEGKITPMFAPKNTTTLIQILYQSLIQAFKAHYHGK